MTPGFKSQQKILRVAHRGFSSDYPENTAASFEAAIRTGTGAIELDIQVSKDGVPFVFHDHDFTRMGHNSPANEKADFNEIKNRDIGSWFDRRFSAQRVVSLDELFLTFIKRVHLMVEIKTWVNPALEPDYYKSLIQHLAKLADQTKSWKNFELLCYSPEVLENAKKTDKRFFCVLNTDETFSPEQLLKFKEIQIDAISIYIENLSREFSKSVKTQGFPLYTFTCNDEEQVEKAVKCDVDAVMSNNPLWLDGLLSNWGL